MLKEVRGGAALEAKLFTEVDPVQARDVGIICVSLLRCVLICGCTKYRAILIAEDFCHFLWAGGQFVCIVD